MHSECMTTLTIRDVPEELRDRLKKRARQNRRSLNQQVITELLEAVERETDEERTARARERMREANEAIDRLREGITEYMTPQQIREAIEEGRA